MPSILSELSLPAFPFSLSLPQSLSQSFPQLRSFPGSFTTSPLAFTLLPISILSIALFLPRVLADYRGYLAVGPGGIPYNFVGYLAQAALKLISRKDLRAMPAPYYRCRHGGRGDGGKGEGEEEAWEIDPKVVAKYGEFGRRSFIEGTDQKGGGSHKLPLRLPPRPTVPNFVAPQRQMDMQATKKMVKRMEGFMAEVVEKQQQQKDGWLRIRPSHLEGVGTPAVWLNEGVEVPEFQGMCDGEIVHAHWEGSSHMTLSLVDAEEAVERGW